MGKRSRRTGNREEHHLVAQLPGARKISRSGYPGPDIEWHGRHVEAKYRGDGFITIYRWLRDVQIDLRPETTPLSLSLSSTFLRNRVGPRPLF